MASSAMRTSSRKGASFPIPIVSPRARRMSDIPQARLRQHGAHSAQAWEQDAVHGCRYSTPSEALTLASVVEKETGLRARAAAHRRRVHHAAAHGMRSQSDPTVIYGIGEKYDGDIRTQGSVDGHALQHLHARWLRRPRRSRSPGRESDPRGGASGGDWRYFLRRHRGWHRRALLFEDARGAQRSSAPVSSRG